MGDLEPAGVTIEGRQRPRCATLVDLLPTSKLAPGDYVFEVFVDKEDRPAGGRADTSSARFSVVAPERTAAAQQPVDN